MADKLEVALEALRHDAAGWHDVARTTATAAAATERLGLRESDLSFASVRGSDLLATYTALQQKAGMLLREATVQLDAMGSTLTEVADRYQANEDAASKEFAGIWDLR